MRKPSRHLLQKTLQILFILGLVLVSPYILGRLGFYGPSYASNPTITSLSTASTKTNPASTEAGLASTASATSTTCALRTSYADAVALAAPAIVSIKTSKEIKVEQNHPLMQDPMFRFYFGDPNNHGGDWPGRNDPRNNEDASPSSKETLQGLGSGVIVSDKGYILTNNHVVKEVDTVTVTLADGRSAEAKVIGSDPDTDLAVLKIKLNQLPTISLGSSAQLRVGDIVLAIGNPFGLDKTVTQGIVSATERTGLDIGILSNLIQTDAAINPGNSGGGLIDAEGHLVGINTAIYSRSGANQGIGFAVPIDTATEVMNQLIDGKRMIRGYLGVMLAPLNDEVREAAQYKTGDGAYIRAVVRNSPAQKAGLLPGDVLIKINGISIADEKIGLRTTAALTPGKSYPIEIFRQGDYLSFVVTPTERNLDQAKKK